jgi:YidC/Oxa1 family membrane protein insertase
VSILNPLADLVAWVIMHLHTGLGELFGPNTGLAWGLSIVILVVLIRICLIPLFVKQVHAQRKMAQHAPHLAELRKKYKNDKQRLNEETMKFYKENGVNPLAGCLPMIPQMIIFFSLFYVLRAIAEWKPGQAPKYGLTVPILQSAQKATIFGVHLSDKLLLPHTPGMGLVPSLIAAVTVIVSCTTTFLTVRQSSKRGLMQTNVDPDNPMAGMQKYMMYIVPFFSLTGLYWQYGLVLYWVTTNMWTLGQQYFMFRNWTTEATQAAGATATAAGGAFRAAQSAMRSDSGSAKTAPSTGKTAPGAARTAPGAARTASGTAKTAANSARTTAGGTRTASAAKATGAAGAGNGRPASGTPRAKTAPGSAGSGTTAGRVQTGSAARDAAANAPGLPNGQNGAAKRGLLRLGRPKQEPVPEPEAPAPQVVRQQPVRQARSKRSGKGNR